MISFFFYPRTCFGGEIRKTTKRKRKVPPTSRKSYLYYGRIPPIQTQHQMLAKKYRNGQQLLKGTCCLVHFLHPYLRLEILEIHWMTFPEQRWKLLFVRKVGRCVRVCLRKLLHHPWNCFLTPTNWLTFRNGLVKLNARPLRS
jgi:hypothetical protein